MLMDRYDHLFRSDNHGAATDAIAGQFSGANVAERPRTPLIPQQKDREFKP